MSDTAIEAADLGRRYGRRGAWALRDCAFRLPAGRVCAVVGPNGAGKSTLFALAAGLMAPTEGELRVLGTSPADARPRVGYVAQAKPLYPQLTVAETLRMGADLNPGRWDAAGAERIVAGGDLDPGARIRSLSGGLRTRVALALALGKRPELLLLDEPMADLDPLARHDLMGVLMGTAAEHGTTIAMSSHVVAARWRSPATTCCSSAPAGCGWPAVWRNCWPPTSASTARPRAPRSPGTPWSSPGPAAASSPRWSARPVRSPTRGAPRRRPWRT